MAETRGEMKHTIILAIAIALAAGPSFASPARVRLTEHQDAEGKRTYYMAPREAVQNSPTWDARSDPPMSVSQAISSAIAWLQAKHASFTFDGVNYVTLSKIWENDFPNRWYYSLMATGRATIDGTEVCKSFNVILLMEGTVVEPSDTEE